MRFTSKFCGLLLCSLSFVAPSRAAETQAAQTLTEAANGRFLVGAAVATRDIDDPKLAALVAR